MLEFVQGVFHIIIWIAQILLALALLVHSYGMLFASLNDKPFYAETYIYDIPVTLRRVLGVVEFLAAIGLILPGLTRIHSWLTPLAAAGIVVLMLCAMYFHRRRDESSCIRYNAILLSFASIIALMRAFVLPV
jgi:uncharacterized membrane protein YphA (DoxX/SURF4 family)